jgi:hypothetical protein
MAKSETYEQFTEKFKPKKTTDDCFTPDGVYAAILGWVRDEYGLGDAPIVRPFWPGADYLATDYPLGSVVVDNPPFSILAKITRHYIAQGVRFFLFAPTLTLFSANLQACHIVTQADIVYENGAVVSTSFITNLDSMRVRTAPALRQAIDDAQVKSTVSLPKYAYPHTVISAARLGKIASVDFEVAPEEAHFVRSLASQREQKKTIFGSGYLISELKAAELKAAELKAAIETTEWHLSDDEKTIISGLGNQAVQNEVTSLLAWREAAQATTDRDKGVVVSKTESVGQGPEPGTILDASDTK